MMDDENSEFCTFKRKKTANGYSFCLLKELFKNTLTFVYERILVSVSLKQLESDFG